MKFIRIPNKKFEMMDDPITQAEWQDIMGINPSHFKNKPNNPVEMISWDDCMTFIKKLNNSQNEYKYRLPTDEEWVYCNNANGPESITEEEVLAQAWCNENSKNVTQPIKAKLPNAFGLYDMRGNVWEWTSTLDGSNRVILGGSSLNDARYLRLSSRLDNDPSARYYNLGARLVRTKLTKLAKILYK